MKRAIAGLLLGSTSLCFAQTHASKPRTKIKIPCTCEDMVGSRYATALRDLLATSPRYDEVSKESEAIVTLHIVTIDTDRDNRGNETAISVVETMNGYYLNQLVQVCGSDRVKQCAETTLASLDDDLQH